MKWFFAAILITALPLVTRAQTSATDSGASDAELSRMVDAVLAEVGTLQRGMTRHAMEVPWRMDGGLQIAGTTRYVLRRCTSIKIDVKFKPADADQSDPARIPSERDDDVVVGISAPYLQGPFYD
jgi:hypothetical protein